MADKSSDTNRSVKFTLPKSGASSSKVLSRSCSTAATTTPPRSAMTERSFTINSRELNDIPEDATKATTEEEEAKAKAKSKRATMVKKALRYFEDKSNRSVSEDNLFTRRKNLAVHLGLDEKVSLREIQKINTYSLPVPSSAAPFSASQPTAPLASAIVVVDDDTEEDEEDVKSKDLVRFLGMKDGITASMASQGRLSDDLLNPPLPQNMPNSARSASLGSATLAKISEENNANETASSSTNSSTATCSSTSATPATLATSSTTAAPKLSSLTKKASLSHKTSQ